MGRKSWAVLLGVLSSVPIDGVSAADGDICYLSGTKSTIVNDQLYFLGGNYSTLTDGGQDVNAEPSSSLYRLSLNASFPVEESIPASLLQSTPIPSESIAYESAADSNGYSADGALWPFIDTVYAFGGRSSLTSSTAADRISRYDTSSNEWTDVSVTGGALNFGRREAASFATAPESRLGFILGGQYPYMSGMVRFDASNPNKLSWTNETLNNGSFGEEVPNLHGAAMIYIPAGSEGMLIVFGGRNISVTLEENADPPIESDWQLIYLYDIASHTWYSQRASGSAPTNRVSFCAALSTAPDNTAFHITAYGGWSRRDGRSYEDVHVLSIPAFEWIDASDVAGVTNGEQDEDRKIGRDALSGACSVVGSNGAQMVVLGGDVRSGGTYVEHGACNGSKSGDDESEAYHPVRVLDLSSYEWRVSLDANASYEVPPVVYRDVGGNSSGSATKTIPAAGFAHPTLESILQQRVSGSSVTTVTSSPSDNPGNTTGTSSSTNTGAIAGGVVGGVAGLAAILALVWFLLRRRKKHLQQSSPGLIAGDSASPVADDTTFKGDQDKLKSEMPGLQGVPVAEMESPEHSMRAELGDGGVSNRHELP
ncbi:hypothetical protein BDW74DRAFT_154510 [Aspergillus multicolor]|uniref:uncharacterized protein n=1 Tax=Aspergillus multicolor TaxID=41759 RepID=UPI003CCDF749